MKLTYDDDSCEIKFNGITIGTWNDEAHCDYPEDLTWSRTIGGLVDQAFMAGVSHGKSELESKLSKAREALEFYAHQNSWTDFLSNYTTINQIQDDDLYEDKDEHGQFLVGGRRAREALKEIGE